MTAYPHTIVVLFSALLLTACEHGKTPTIDGEDRGAVRTSSAHGEDPPAAAAQVELDSAPHIDLIANRFRLHLYRDGGLVVPFASEGLHKYAQEYSRPFGGVVKVDGRIGRVLSASSATLRVPQSTTDARMLRFFVHGLTAGQSVAVEVNGKRAGTVSLPNEWAVVDLPVDAGLFVVGENEIRLRPKKSGKAAGKKSYALWYALEVGPTEPSDGYPAVDPVKDDAVFGYPRIELYTEIPPTAWFSVHTTASASITATTEGGEVVELLKSAAPSGAQLIDLSPVAGQLVRLDLLSSGGWGAPVISLKAAGTRPKPSAQNVVLVVVDALRADHLALYGDTPVQTPRITAAAKHGAVFLNNQSASPSSPPSHASIQTGMIPRVHGVVGDKGKLNPGVPLISTLLGKAGIATAYVGNNSFGMSRLRKAGAWTTFTSPLSQGKGEDCAQVVEGVLAFAKAQHAAGKRFFVSALPMETHAPYRFHEGVTRKYHDGEWKPPLGKNVSGHRLEDIIGGRVKMDDGQWSQLRALYDGEVEHMDTCFGQLQDGLAELGLTDSTAIVLTSDHGEGMGERDRLGHAYGHFGELANVPFVVFAPSIEGPLKLSTVTGHLEVAPTVLDLLGVAPSDGFQGQSVLPIIDREGPWTPRVVSLEYGRSFALRSERWKMIVDYSGNEALFDHHVDPLDQHDVGAQHPMALRYLREASGFFLEHRSEWKSASWGTLNNHAPGAFE